MKVSFLLPYANPHVLDWVLEMSSVELNIGCMRSTQEYRPGYFKEYDEIEQIKYFFKSPTGKDRFQKDLADSDVLFTLGIFEPYLLKLRRFCKRDIRLIVISESFNPINSKAKGLQRKIWSWLVNSQYRKIDFFCIGAEDVKNYYYSMGFKTSKFYNFGYFPNISFKSPKYKKYGETVKVGFIGQLIHRKGFDRLICLAEYLTLHNKDYEFLIAGDGSLKPKLLGKIQDLDNPRIVYLGLIKEKSKVESFLENLDILFVPSYFDGWGAIVNEGVAKSVAIVSSDSVYSYRYLFKSSRNGDVKREPDMVGLVSDLINDIKELNRQKEISCNKQPEISCESIAGEVLSILKGEELNKLIVRLF